MIRIGYVKTDGTDVVYDTVSGAVNATASVNALKMSLAGDSSVKYFYLNPRSLIQNGIDTDLSILIKQSARVLNKLHNIGI